MKTRTAIPFAVAALAALSLSACTQTGANKLENQQQYQDELTYENAQPIPHFNYSVYREVGTDVEAIQALGEQTTSFFFGSIVNSGPIFTCPSLGEPFPNTASLSNPLQVLRNRDAVVGQMDPNGIYNPSASEGTYVLCINAQGQKYLQYWEGPVMAVSGTARWDAKSKQIVVFGAPAMPTCVVAGNGQHRATSCKK